MLNISRSHKRTLVLNNSSVPVEPKPTGTFARLKLWGDDPQVVADNYSVFRRLINGEPVAQFSHFQPYMLDYNGMWVGSWVSNDLYYRHDTASLMKIAALQNAANLQQVMNWLMYGGQGTWGAVMAGEYPTGAQWAEAINIRQIGAVYAGQLVEIVERRTFASVSYNGKVEDAIPMSRIRTFDPSQDWGKTNATHPHLVHEVTCVTKDDQPMHAPVGVVYLPLVFRHASIWLMDRHLVFS